eukprot:jgi/Tetstr1/439950/TSEL_003016.t1
MRRCAFSGNALRNPPQARNAPPRVDDDDAHCGVWSIPSGCRILRLPANGDSTARSNQGIVMERPSFAVDEVKGLALTYGNAQSEGSAYPRMLAIAGAALDIDMDTPHTDEAYTDEDDNGATPHGHASARHPNRAGNEKRDKD